METVTFGNASVRVYERNDGKWLVKWREGGRGRSTTKTKKEDALSEAKDQARRLDGASGRQWVSSGEAELVRKLKRLAGDRPPFAWLDLVEDAIRAAGGLKQLRDAAKAYSRTLAKAGSTRTFAELYDRLEDEYREHRRSQTWKTVRTELKRYRSEIGGLTLEAITPENVADWCGRGTPSARTYNNRRTIWGAAFARARELGWIDAHSRTAAEMAPKRREIQKSPSVWTPDDGREVLELLRKSAPDLIAYFALQCWAGLRPSEAQALEWRDIGSPEGYVHVRHEVAGKLGAERFVPIQPNLASILKSLPPVEERLPAERSAAHRRRDLKRLEQFPAPLNAASRLAAVVCDAGIVDEWPRDVCRHSFCSYRLAVTKAIGTVAEEAGNSEGVIRRSYRRPVPKEVGEVWFAVG